MAPKRDSTVYGRVSTNAEGDEQKLRRRGSAEDSESEEDVDALDERTIAKKKWVRRLNWVWRKLNSAFWVGLACFMIWWTNFFRVIWESPLVNRAYFHIAMACLFFNMSLLAYLAVWCSAIKGIEEPWETYQPKAIPVMAVVGFATACFFFFALYPVWGLMTILIQLIFFMGFINAGSFLPSGNLGSILMFVIFFGAFFTSELIPHEGLAHYTPRPTVGR
mmetsp:Transcript_56970/g.159884  ORF Transcript_56970/g.159884 Transcript_56970/m.159884 type:complete len:220 (+) Transcript_56970:75-734(+)